MPAWDGTPLWTVCSGSGPPVVFVHGGPGLWDYLGPLAELLDDRVTAIRYDQRGCARSGGADGPFTIVQALDDLDRVRAAYGLDQVSVVGHSWGAEVAVRYAARYTDHVRAVAYLAGVGAGETYLPGFSAERDRRLGPDKQRWDELRARARTQDEERELCLLQWRPDFAPTPDASRHAEALWATRPPNIAVNQRANRELWADRASVDLLGEAAAVGCPVRMIQGAADPRPWQATDPLLAALPDGARTVLEGAGHLPWAERPRETRDLVLSAVDL